MTLLFVLLSFLTCFIGLSSQNSLDDTLHLNISTEGLFEDFLFLKRTVDDVAVQLEKYNFNQQKLTNVMLSISNVESSIKSLQEKTQVWEIFHHNINAWNDHIKSIDNKIDILKGNQENYVLLENKFQNLDFKVQYIFDKVNSINEKVNDINLGMSNIQRAPKCHEQSENLELNEILNRLNSMQKQMQHSSMTRILQKYHQKNRLVPQHHVMQTDDDDFDLSSSSFGKNDLHELKTGVQQIYEMLQIISSKELNQLLNDNKKNTKSTTNLVNLIKSLEHRSLNIYEKLIVCCENTEHEITTFTNSADLLLKRLEKLLLRVDKKQLLEAESSVESSTTSVRPAASTPAATTYGNDEDEEDNAVASGEAVLEPENDDVAPDLSNINVITTNEDNCFKLRNGSNGVYKFNENNVPQLQMSDNNFNEYQYCEFNDIDIGWTLIQRRGNYENNENFNRSWNDYKYGFGDLNQEFWLGNDLIHKLTKENNMKLLVVLEDFNNNVRSAEYAIFRIESEELNYNLVVAENSGNLTDSLLYHNDQSFSTFDRINDNSNSVCCPCSSSYGGGWWFNNCAESNLNGIYYKEPHGHQFRGIIWENWLGPDYSLKSSKMMIRPNTNSDGFLVPLHIPEDP